MSLVEQKAVGHIQRICEVDVDNHSVLVPAFNIQIILNSGWVNVTLEVEVKPQHISIDI